MNSSTVPEALLGATLLGSVLGEPEEHEELIREEAEHWLRELVHQLVERLEESYTSSTPRSGWEAVRRAEEVIEEITQREEAQSIKHLLEYIDIESYVREQARLFARVNELYEGVYRRYTGSHELAEIGTILMTLTAVKALYLTSIEHAKSIHVSRKATALLAVLLMLTRQRRLDIVKQLPWVAEETLAVHLAGSRECSLM